MKRILYIIGLPLLLLVGYLMLAPVPIELGAWKPLPAPAMEGDFAVNTLLATADRLAEADGTAPEDLVLDAAGRIYSGFLDGRVVRWEPDGTGMKVIADTKGRPLGMRFDAQGQLIVADAVRGLLSISTETGEIAVLSTEHGGRPFRFADDLDIGADGTIYFSDASDKFGHEVYMLDLLEHRPNGRVLAYDPQMRETRLLIDQLYFANGVAIDPNQEFLLVCETGKYRVLRYWLKGPKAGQTEKFLDNLPGFPDNVSSGSDGIFWVAIPSLRDATLDATLPLPFLRKMIVRLPAFLRPKPTRHSFVLGVDSSGKVRYNLQDPGGRYAPITSVQEHGGKLYFGSIIENGFGRIARPDGAS
jgi:sugar lactone lactonase YvrE